MYQKDIRARKWIRVALTTVKINIMYSPRTANYHHQSYPRSQGGNFDGSIRDRLLVSRIQNQNMVDGAGRFAIGRDKSHIRLPTKITPLDPKNSIKWGEEILRVFESVECTHFYNETYVAVLKADYDETLIKNRNRFWLDVDTQPVQTEFDTGSDLEHLDDRSNDLRPRRRVIERSNDQQSEWQRDTEQILDQGSNDHRPEWQRATSY